MVQHLSKVWSWEEVPVPWDTAKVDRWLGTRAMADCPMPDLISEALNQSSP